MRHSRLFSPVLRRLTRQKKQVWPTIDDGPSHETGAVPALLDRYDAKATFFRVADRAAAHPELAREIQRRGHGVGNHAGLEIWRI